MPSEPVRVGLPGSVGLHGDYALRDWLLAGNRA
jgi:hypothetical protein